MARDAGSALPALTALLRQMDVEELAALLAARPDAAAVPEPRTLSELAMRLGGEYSLRGALCRLTVPQVELAEALQALGDGCARTDLERLLGVGEMLDQAALDELLDGLRRLALAWTEGPVLHIAPGMERITVDPLALGPPAADLLAELTVDQLSQIAASYGIEGRRSKPDWIHTLVEVLADPQRLRTALDDAPPGIEATVEQLVWQTPRAHGPVQFALYRSHGHGLSRSLLWLARHGFLLPSGWDTGQMPREVALALRGPNYHPALHLKQPPLATAETDPEPAPRVRVVDGVQRLLAMLGHSPAQQLAAGGVGVRELRRIAKELGSTEREVRLWLELAAFLRLLLPSQDGDVLPTHAADAWSALPPGAQLTELIEAWCAIGVVPSHRMNAEGRPLPALDPGGSIRIGPALRTDLLRLLAEYPAGTAVTDLDSLIDVLAWRHPVRYHSTETLGPYLVATWSEAQQLGLVADRALSPLGRAAATGGEPEELARLADRILPTPVSQATFLPDLSAVVSGPPSAELAGLLDTVADLEARDTASTWRFSPASVRRALDGGHTADGLLARLAEVADRPLPQPLEYLVTDAARRHGQVRVRPVACAVCTPDPALAAEIAAHRTLAGLKLSQLAPTVLGSTKPAAETLRLLRAAGYSPVQQSPTGRTIIERAAPRRAPDPQPTRRTGSAAPPAPDALARRLLAAGPLHVLPGTEPSGSTCERNVRANAKALDDAQARLLAHAIEHHSPVRIDYVSSSGGYTQRIIEPIALFFDAIQAWCRLRGGERVFRLDRICAVAPA